MKIIITGAQGEGRTLVAEMLRAALTLAGKTIIVDDAQTKRISRRPHRLAWSGTISDVSIYTRLDNK